MTATTVLVAAWFPGGMRAVAPLVPAFRARGWSTHVVTTDVAFTVALRSGMQPSALIMVNPGDAEAAVLALRSVPASLVVVAIGEGTLPERRLVAEARRTGVPSLGVLDTWGDVKRRLGGDDRVDILAVMNEAARHEIEEAHLYTDRPVIVAGHAGLEEFFATDDDPATKAHARGSYGIALDRDVITFFSQPIEQIFGMQLGFTQYDSVSALGAAIEDDSELLIAAHPRDDPNALAGAAGGRGRVLNTYDPAALYVASDIVASSFSACLVEAVLARRAVVSIQPGLIGEDRCWTNRIGASEAAFSSAQVAGALARAHAAGRCRAELDRRRLLIDIETGSVDRLCRIAEQLLAHNRTDAPAAHRL